MKKTGILPAILLITSILFLSGCSQPEPVDITPKPQTNIAKSGSFDINNDTKISYDISNEELGNAVRWFREFIKNGSGIDLLVEDAEALKSSSNTVIINLNSLDENDEGYKLNINKSKISIDANSVAGIFYAFQTLRQMMPNEIEVSGAMNSISVQCSEISDAPEYSWRGMHLDVSRHFFPMEFVKKYIDLIAFHKMNVFHWHLTDDNGWRVEIKKYPQLQEVAAWRVEREWLDKTPPRKGEEATYGGYYTQEEIKEVVAYAAQRQIMVIPEIEMPGHTCEVLAAYPELGCTGGPYYVQPGTYWPNDDIFCAGNEKVFEFLEDVLDEVMTLFPAPYIHIGGDEATKTEWEQCPKCQKRIKDEGLANVEELQSYFVKRMEKYLNANGRQLIGWDEILEGGLAPEATVMSWRGQEGGIAAAKSGHDAIMCPVSHCYFDYYQADPEFQPAAIGGFTTLKKVYSFNPTPAELNPEETKHILGGQGNLWTEWIATPEHAEYMVVPRMTALAEKLWTEEKLCDWYDFRNRLENLFIRFDLMDVNYCKGSFNVDAETHYVPDNNYFKVTLSTEALSDAIYYTLDNRIPDSNSLKYEHPLEISKSCTINAVAYKDGVKQEKHSSTRIALHKGIGKSAQLTHSPAEKYNCNGTQTLLNGLFGSRRHADGQWLGFSGDDLEMIIDLEKDGYVNKVQVNALAAPGIWIFLPDEVSVYISSDNQDFRFIGSTGHTINHQLCDVEIVPFVVNTESVSGRYLKVIAKNVGVLPEWHSGAENPSWLFVDEVIIEE